MNIVIVAGVAVETLLVLLVAYNCAVITWERHGLVDDDISRVARLAQQLGATSLVLTDEEILHWTSAVLECAVEKPPEQTVLALLSWCSVHGVLHLNGAELSHLQKTATQANLFALGQEAGEIVESERHVYLLAWLAEVQPGGCTIIGQTPEGRQARARLMYHGSGDVTVVEPQMAQDRLSEPLAAFWRGLASTEVARKLDG